MWNGQQQGEIKSSLPAKFNQSADYAGILREVKKVLAGQHNSGGIDLFCDRAFCGNESLTQQTGYWAPFLFDSEPIELFIFFEGIGVRVKQVGDW